MFQTAGGRLGGARPLLASRCRTRRPRKLGHAVTMRDILGLDALKLMKERSFAIFVARLVPDLHPAAVLLRASPAPFLSEIGVHERRRRR